MSNSFNQAIERITEIVMFENWLRFYFIAEGNGDDLVIRIPDQGMKKIESLYPHLAGLADRLNHGVITHDSSLREICLFVASSVDGATVNEATTQQVFASGEFQMAVQLFSTWVQAHEEQLDETFTDFGSWKKMFGEWQNSPQIQEYIASVKEKLQRTATEGTLSPQ